MKDKQVDIVTELDCDFIYDMRMSVFKFYRKDEDFLDVREQLVFLSAAPSFRFGLLYFDMYEG